ncbi:MAG: selenium metabolism-associated LysR family transcriptional regulator [bacterium]|jgi:DNA-binding transcriptional LysR family regulator|nr:selenium metabolism-associated LysR family transcriptional regulator [bacterium]
MHSLDLRQVEIFYYVAKLRSFSKAAQALRLTQPTVSGHIKSLEESLSLRLFDRLGREVRLTQAGGVLYSHAKRLLSTKSAALQALQEFQGGLQGELVIGGSSIPGQYVLPVLFGQFTRSYPGVTAILNITDTMDMVDQIVHGDLELGIVGAQVPHAQVLYHQFIDDELVLAVSKEHVWAGRHSVPLAALHTQPFIQRERGSGSRLVVEQTFKQHGFDTAMLHVIAEVASTEAIKQGIKAGLGWGIISRFALTDELRAGSLCTVPIQDVVLQRSFYIIRHKARTLSPLVQTFEHFLLSSDPAALLT